jgi:hypothetical protein
VPSPRKAQYLLWSSPRTPARDFAARVRADLAPQLLELGSFALELTQTELAPPRLSLFPFRRQPVALLSLRGSDLPEPRQCAELLRPHAERVAGYAVDESLPVTYERTWADGEPTPGVSLLTLFRRRRGLTDADFLRRWHEGHTPLTLRTHPVWRYVRNVVREPLLDDSPPFDGIVQEHFRTRADLLNPLRFYDGPWRMLPNMVRVGLDVAGFIDLKTIETYLAVETHARSGLNQTE